LGSARPFSDVKLFCGVIFAAEADCQRAREALAGLFSPIDFASAAFPFTETDYYQAEMGGPLCRRFFAHAALIRPERLPQIKRQTNRLESEMSVAGRRLVNLDPGYLSESNVIIATVKNHYHRVPLGLGIYGHIEYVFRNRRLEALEWTYPDFRGDAYRAFFLELRRRYMAGRGR